MPVPQTWKSGLKDYDASLRRRSSGAKAAQRGFAKRSHEELAYFLSERRRDSQATGRSSSGTCSDVPPPTISSDAWLVSPRWKHFETDRDYLLLRPTLDLQGVRDCYASYNDAAALSQALYNELRWPKLCPERVWQGSADEALLCQGAGRFWTEHSERNGLTSMGAALGFGEAQRKHLGRWTTDCSEGYVRTTTAIVHEIQGKCARALREGAGQADFLAEFALLADLDRLLEAKGYTSEAREHQKERLQFFKDREGLLPASSEAAGDGQAAELSKVDAETVLEELPPLPGHCFISLTRRGRTTASGPALQPQAQIATAGRTTVRTFRHPRSTRLCARSAGLLGRQGLRHHPHLRVQAVLQVPGLALLLRASEMAVVWFLDCYEMVGPSWSGKVYL